MNDVRRDTSVASEKLKPLLHMKIETMDERHLDLLNSVLLQIEAEELASKLGQEFDSDQSHGKLQRIPDLVRQFRAEHRYQ